MCGNHTRFAVAGLELQPLRRIGEGSFACVLLACKCEESSLTVASSSDSASASLKEPTDLCAIKIFKHKGKELVQLAMREAAAHSRLNGHPNIVHLRGSYQSSGGRPIMLMEYCPRSLQGELRKHPFGLPGPAVKLLTWQLLQAVRAIHAKKLLHRDIKPGNILLTDEGVLKVCDFGLARAAPQRQPRTGAADEPLSAYVFTRWYRAPEVLLNKPYGSAADIWSVGCTVAEMAIGSPLLPGSSSIEQIFEIWRMFGGRLGSQCSVDAPAAPAVWQPQARKKSSLRSRLGAHVEEPLLDLLEAALRTNPRQRAAAEELLGMPYFNEIPDLTAGTILDGLYDRCSGEEHSPPARPSAAAGPQGSALERPPQRAAEATLLGDGVRLQREHLQMQPAATERRPALRARVGDDDADAAAAAAAATVSDEAPNSETLPGGTTLAVDSNGGEGQGAKTAVNSGGADPRVMITMQESARPGPRVVSVPILDGQRPAELAAAGALHRAATFAAGGKSPAGGENGHCGGGGEDSGRVRRRQLRAPTIGRHGGATSTRRDFAKLRTQLGKSLPEPSPLQLTTMTVAEGPQEGQAEEQVEGPASGRPRGVPPAIPAGTSCVVFWPPEPSTQPPVVNYRGTRCVAECAAASHSSICGCQPLPDVTTASSVRRHKSFLSSTMQSWRLAAATGSGGGGDDGSTVGEQQSPLLMPPPLPPLRPRPTPPLELAMPVALGLIKPAVPSNARGRGEDGGSTPGAPGAAADGGTTCVRYVDDTAEEETPADKHTWQWTLAAGGSTLQLQSVGCTAEPVGRVDTTSHEAVAAPCSCRETCRAARGGGWKQRDGEQEQGPELGAAGPTAPTVGGEGLQSGPVFRRAWEHIGRRLVGGRRRKGMVRISGTVAVADAGGAAGGVPAACYCSDGAGPATWRIMTRIRGWLLCGIKE